jgi:hypothetical protein
MEPADAPFFQSDPRGALALVYAGHPVWTRLELAREAQDTFRMARPSAKPDAGSAESRFLAIRLQGRSSGRDDRRRLQVRTESQQTAIAILHHELARVPWHVGRSPSEFYALGCVLGIECVGIFD